MNDVWRIFRKDGLEVLRDRRTLFVNLVLPVLLYPVLLMFMVQVLQLTNAAPGEPQRIAVIDGPGALHRLLRTPPTGDEHPKRAVAGALSAPKASPMVIATLPDADSQRLAELVETAGKDPLNRSPEALALLRKNHLVAVLVHHELPDGRHRLAVLQDDANSRVDEVQSRIVVAIDAWRRELLVERLRAAGLPETTLSPVEAAVATLAPAAESVRTRIAGIIPLLLVLLAASGAFYPALDLIAGERERGTLETLLSLPVKRRDIFLGKLLVCCAGALVAVSLNLLSLAGSVGVLGAQLRGSAPGVDLSGMFAVGAGSLALCFIALLPLTVTLAAVGLAVTGLSHSAKEAANYVSPLILVVLFAAMVAVIPGTRPTFALDLVPVTGVVLALKDSLQSPTPPWLHLGLATASSLALAAVVVSWSARLLDSERFRYPGLVRAGWGRFRRWGAAPDAPGGLEVLGVYAIAVMGMTMGAGLLAGMSTVTMVAAPLLLFILVPALAHAWLGGYRPEAISLVNPGWRGWAAGVLVLPFGIGLSLLVGALQSTLVPKEVMEQGGDQVMEAVKGIRAQGGPVFGTALLLVCVALLPGICEELLCRGTLFAGLRKGLGVTGAALISGFLFAALHMSPWRFAPQMALGIMLAVVVWRTRSVFPAMLIHAGHNATLVLVELYANSTDAPRPLWIAAFAAVAVSWAVFAWRLTARK